MQISELHKILKFEGVLIIPETMRWNLGQLVLLAGLIADISCLESFTNDDDITAKDVAISGPDDDQGPGVKAPEPRLASMKWTLDKGFTIVEGELSTAAETVAWINYTNEINATGWSYLEINTVHRFPDKVQVQLQRVIRREHFT